PTEGRNARPAPRGREPCITRPRLLPRGPPVQFPRTTRARRGDGSVEHTPVARPRQRAPPRFRRGGRLRAAIAASRLGSGRAPVAGDRPADGNRSDGHSPRPRRVLHPAVPTLDCATDVRLPRPRRHRDLLRDGLVRGTHLPRDPAETCGGRSRHARRPPLRDRDLCIPSHLLPERGRPRVRVRGWTVLRTHRPQDAQPLGCHPESQPWERHFVSRRAVLVVDLKRVRGPEYLLNRLRGWVAATTD